MRLRPLAIASVTAVVTVMTALGKSKGRDRSVRSLPLLCIENEIKSVLATDRVRICGIMHKGHINTHILFIADDQKYLYRTSWGADYFDIETDYSAEATANRFAAYQKIDGTFIYLNKKTGSKISYYLDDSHVLDEHDQKQLSDCVSILKKFHNASFETFPITQELDFERLLNKYHELIKQYAPLHCEYYEDFFAITKKIFQSIKHQIVYSGCHFDCHQGNFLFDLSGKIHLIDYEHCKRFDYRFDLASLSINCYFDKKSTESMWDEYYERSLVPSEKVFLWKMCVLCAFYNIQWAIYAEKNNIDAAPYIRTNAKIIGRYLADH